MPNVTTPLGRNSSAISSTSTSVLTKSSVSLRRSSPGADTLKSLITTPKLAGCRIARLPTPLPSRKRADGTFDLAPDSHLRQRSMVAVAHPNLVHCHRLCHLCRRFVALLRGCCSGAQLV